MEFGEGAEVQCKSGKPRTKSLNARLREVVANQRPGKQIVYKGQEIEPLHPIGLTLPSGAYPICCCGDESVVVVAKTEKNAGRRFFGCPAFEDHRYYPNDIHCCNFMQWIDPPMCQRGLQYALEAQAEIRRLNKIVADATRAGYLRNR